MKKYLFFFFAALAGCGSSEEVPDAYGNFEAQETLVSAEATGKLLAFEVEEGQVLAEQQVVGSIDPTNLELQKSQLEASLEALNEKQGDPEPQVAVLEQQMVAAKNQALATEEQLGVTRQQITNLEREKNRVQNLIRENAATQKQLDDITGQIAVLQRQVEVQKQQVTTQNQQVAVLSRQVEATRANIGIQNRGILSEAAPLGRRIAQLDDQITRTTIQNPVQGTILSKYAAKGEIVNFGKPLYKIADLSTLTLRAYITGRQLPTIKLGQRVKVMTDGPDGKLRSHNGSVSWISGKAEFTPKTVQTREERATLVYAIKVRVPNEKGELKIGMPGEVKF
ncbi:MAG: HlyD family efflux transporter periplasmic adaptor subunit [Bacteroidetes Order II. Incertae sedis bacterium]|nr:HlyD family efflux transporter periplasmic adaptor subunit [Bacteroidetes Order II. bacterium]